MNNKKKITLAVCAIALLGLLGARSTDKLPKLCKEQCWQEHQECLSTCTGGRGYDPNNTSPTEVKCLDICVAYENGCAHGCGLVL